MWTHLVLQECQFRIQLFFLHLFLKLLDTGLAFKDPQSHGEKEHKQ